MRKREELQIKIDAGIDVIESIGEPNKEEVGERVYGELTKLRDELKLCNEILKWVLES